MDVIIANLPYMMRGLQVTLVLSVLSLAGSLLLGAIIAVARLVAWRWLRTAIGIFVDAMRMIPLIMVIFWIFFLLPILTGRSVAPFTAAVVALIVFNASYMAEIIRAGIEAVPKGLNEAARAAGLTGLQSMIHVVLPLAFKSMLPAMVNRSVVVLMGTSLAYTIGVTEFFRAASEVNFRVFRPGTILTFVALVYFLLCFGLSSVGRWLARRFAQADRSPDLEFL
jgi:His/Glu/Gln/Arg/opine family amino acid ABC transporter permease subunit